MFIRLSLVSTLMTAEVAGVHVITGLAPPKPDLDWARMHMLVTNEEYRGRVRILISNLEKGVDPDVAFRLTSCWSYESPFSTKYGQQAQSQSLNTPLSSIFSNNDVMQKTALRLTE